MTGLEKSAGPAGKSYRFLTGPDSPDFCQRVSDALAEGWVLYGNPVLAEKDGVLYVGQAVILPGAVPINTLAGLTK
jgi:hypothetical protein